MSNIECMKNRLQEAKRVAESMGLDAVVLVAFKGRAFSTTSYGKDAETCKAFSKVCDQIHDDIAYGVIEIPDV